MEPPNLANTGLKTVKQMDTENENNKKLPVISDGAPITDADPLLFEVVKACEHLMEPALYTLEEESFFGPVAIQCFRLKEKIVIDPEIDTDTEGNPVHNFDCPPFVRVNMSGGEIGIRFFTRGHNQPWAEQHIGEDNLDYIEYVPHRKYESLAAILSTFLVAGHNEVEPYLKELIAIGMESAFNVEIGSVELAGVEDTIDICYRTLTISNPRLVPRHILLAGKMGYGKSEIVKELVRRTPDWIHYQFDPDLLVNQNLVKNLNKILTYIGRRMMVVADEIDEIALHRGHHDGDIYNLLRLLDGVASTDMIRFVATTNRPKDLDPALKRIGRFGPMIILEDPTEEQFKQIVEYYKDRYDASEVDTDELATRRDNVAGCDIRAAFENCIIKEIPISTQNVIEELQLVLVAKQMDFDEFL